MTPRSALRVAVLVVAASGLARNAVGQPTTPSTRQGLVLGASVGLGNSSPDLCAKCGTGLAVTGRLGSMVKARLAVVFEGMIMGVAPQVPSKSGARHKALTAGLQYWPGSRLWVLGGAGAGWVQRYDVSHDQMTTHVAGMAGIGFELNPNSKIVFEIALHDVLSGDSSQRFSDEPGHKGTVNTLILSIGAVW